MRIFLQDDKLAKILLSYDTISEALDDQRNKIVDTVARRYIDDYFGGDDYFLQPLREEIDRVSYNVKT